MNLTLSEEQELIRESVADYFARAYSFDDYRRRLGGSEFFDARAWRDMAGLGWIGLAVSPERGGLGLGAQELGLILDGAGAALALEPLVAVAAMSAPLLAAACKNAVVEEALAAIVAGERTAALAWSEPARGFEPLAIGTRIETVAGGGYAVTGRKTMVEHGGAADWLIVPGRLDRGMEGGADGEIALLLLPGEAEGIERTAVRMADGTQCADIALDGARAGADALLARGDEARDLLLAALHRGLAATCAQAVGAMRQALALCRDYLHERVQFGVPLASMQALQHRFAEMTMAFERAVSMATLASIQADAAPADAQAAQDLRMAKYIVGQSARYVGAQAIQLHGGMGMTLEYPVGHYYRKLLCCDAALGSCEDHLGLLAGADAPR
jgi:alkylation response protein AidB-like acyl-CoA dehydrogenase